MPHFSDTADVRRVLGGFFEQMATDPDYGPIIRAERIWIIFTLHDPDLILTVDGLHDPPPGQFFAVQYEPPATPAEVRIACSADVAHRFWLGRLNVMLALTGREITVEGSLARLLPRLPLLAQAFPRYRAWLEAQDRPDLLGE